MLEAMGTSVNFGTAMGRGTIRLAAMGVEARRASPQEMETMRVLPRQALDDGAFSLPSGQLHPRWYGTFPRVIARYCRKRKLFPPETAVFKMTGLPAWAARTAG